MRKSLPGIALVHAPTRLEGLRRRWGTIGQAKFLLGQAHQHDALRRTPAPVGKHRTSAAPDRSSAQRQADFDEYETEDAAYRQTLDVVERDLGSLGLPVHRVERSFLANFDFGNCIVVVVVGQDGLVANTAKYIGELPIVAVNPDPGRIDGVLLPFHVKQAAPAVKNVIHGTPRSRRITLAEVVLNDGQRLLAFNDLFVGAASHVSARYVLETPEGSEPQSSSGIIISTGAGATGWLSSVFNMAAGVASAFGGSTLKRPQSAWEDRRLIWAVREPFLSKRSGATLVAGGLEEGRELVIESLMPEGGVIFSDGVEADFLPFNSGTIARVGVARQQANLVVP